jgi:drug/metabolite transporter (DMT)-like permease
MALGATLGLSLKGILAKLAFLAGASVIIVVLLRMLMALPLFIAADRVMRAKDRPRMSRADMALGLGFGVLFLVAMLSDFIAIDRLGAGLSRIVLFTYPLFVVLIAAGMERRWPSGRQLLAFAISYVGLVIVLRPDRVEIPPQFWSGVGFAVLCAFTIACVYAFANPLIKRIGSSRFSILTHTTAAAGMIIVAASTQSADSFAFSAEAYFWIVLIVVLATVAPIMMQYEAMRRIGAARVSLIGLLGPVVTIIAAWVVLDERLDRVQIAGFGLVLLGVTVLEWPTLKRAFGR